MPAESSGRSKVLVLGDDTRSFLATVRSLGRSGLEVHAAPFNFRSPALRSRYLSKIHWLPYYLGDGAHWLAEVRRLIAEHRFSLLVPCDERTLLPLHWHREELSTATKLAIPSPEAIEVFFDKQKTRALASSLKIPVAPGRLINADDTTETIIAESGLPVAIKPASSYTADRLYSRNAVVIARTEAELAEALRDSQRLPYFFESFFPGQGMGVSVLAHEGRIVQAFEHHRVHELQGASHYRVSAPLSPHLIDAASRIVEATHYTGLAMLEFRTNPESGQWILIEINARPWGSMPLPVAIGVDFPYRLYQLLVAEIETSPSDYRPGIYGRNFVPDTDYLRARLRTTLPNPVSTTRFLTVTLREYLRWLSGREVYDVSVPDDRSPARREFQQFGRRLLARFTPSNDWLERHRDRRRTSTVLEDGCNEIAFVCQGNVCRSPFAAALLRRMLAQGTGGDIRISSYANLPREGRHSPENAIKAALAYDIDLSEHRSRHFSRDAAERAALIIVFDAINEDWIRQRYLELSVPVVRLGSFGDHGRDIADPDGGTLEQFVKTYQRVATAIDGLKTHIRASLRHG